MEDRLMRAHSHSPRIARRFTIAGVTLALLASSCATASWNSGLGYLQDDASTGNAMERSGATAADEAADRETKALDSTATQWSFQFSYQVMPN